jgi:hypothetical protein
MCAGISVAIAAMAIGLAPAAVAYAGGTPAPSGTGGSEYGAALATAKPARPIARIFTVNPKVVVAPRLPRLRVRIDQPGSRSVRARLVFRPRSGGALVRVDAGRVRTGKRVAVAWPAGSQLSPGRYVVQLIVRGRGNAVLARTARATGKTTVTVRAPAPPPAAAPTPAPTAPVAPGAGVFPVAGAHTYGDGFGAARTGHTHQGQDIAAAEGVPVVAPLAATVTAVDNQPSAAGWYIVLHTVDGRDMFFAHCQEGSIPLTPGVAVTAGQPMCLVGHTGDATGPHLHFEIWLGGWRVNAASQPVDPLADLLAWDPTA